MTKEPLSEWRVLQMAIAQRNIANGIPDSRWCGDRDCDLNGLEHGHRPAPSKPCEPYVTITRVGRWKHEISICDGAFDWVTVTAGAAYGRRRAERKARKLLDRLLLKQSRERDTVRIDAEER